MDCIKKYKNIISSMNDYGYVIVDDQDNYEDQDDYDDIELLKLYLESQLNMFKHEKLKYMLTMMEDFNTEEIKYYDESKLLHFDKNKINDIAMWIKLLSYILIYISSDSILNICKYLIQVSLMTNEITYLLLYDELDFKKSYLDTLYNSIVNLEDKYLYKNDEILLLI